MADVLEVGDFGLEVEDIDEVSIFNSSNWTPL